MRCLTLGKALSKAGFRVTFISRELEGNINHHIAQQGFNVIPLATCGSETEISSEEQHTAHHAWLECSWQQDYAATRQALQNLPAADWLIVDHYALDEKWEQAISPACKHILVIDDLADRKHAAAVLLDQNLYPDARQRYRGFVPTDCTLLLGPEYALLRDEFSRIPQNTITIRTQINRVLVFFGGVDTSNETCKAIEAIGMLEKTVTTDVIIGASNPHKTDIEQHCQGILQCNCHHHVDNIAHFMTRADIAIGGGGTTTWERCYLGLPSITLTLADNQLTINETIADHGACIHAGDTTVTAAEITEHLNRLMHTPGRLETMSRAARSIMQGHIGAQGVAEIMGRVHA